MNVTEATALLSRHLKDKFAHKHVRNAIDYIAKGWTMLACEECKSGHFIVGHDGDKTFLPVRVWLEDLLSASDPTDQKRHVSH